MSSISKSLRQQVINEAGYRCEYCRTSSRLTGMPLVMDHILPSSLGGNDERENLAACCYRCNEFKGAKITANDPVKNESISLFNPRLQRWLDHFQWANGGTHIIGITAIGRATVLALRLNNEDVVQARAIWISLSWHPPND
ncbi:HNH endonuclease signature motif containing protein [Dolichospermum sp. UHCC 0684]|uniref:HNH endonuclease n=1 Tax=Nostocales TaxID=1161 RepID=UPI00029B5F46|nr:MULTISPECIES: HNH endonuclease signature motif containing protein [Nostocales]MBO1051313.1 HNH endonuclease [Dolichospermum sp. DET73]MBS9387366.1 HNH endonuclease [Dolichospermum sp. WA123]MTJ17757.1 HNH endonuclease [Dolichospermum sp. UHCC 0299]MTJ22209.1 HNH endonuclease [Dolichospermum sp. UHCC 0352]MTJ34948.1 HNH endonuclease [Dolichospermum sp. UHCC 0260]MTJ38105.1 HNH endonuclease [Dolichospermum sp. UHCC 0406]